MGGLLVVLKELLRIRSTVPVQEPVVLVLQILLNLATHGLAVVLATTAVDVLGHRLARIVLTVSIAHEVIEARSLEAHLQSVLVQDKAVDKGLLLLDKLRRVLRDNLQSRLVNLGLGIVFQRNNLSLRKLVVLVHRRPTGTTAMDTHGVDTTCSTTVDEMLLSVDVIACLREVNLAGPERVGL